MRNRSFGAVNSRMGGGVRQFATLRDGIAVATLVGCFAFGPSAQATEDEPHVNTFEITPFFGLMAGGSFEDPTDSSERDVEDDTSFGIFLNLIADVPERQYELLYTKQSSVVEGGVPVDLDLQYLQIGGTVGYPQSRYIAPYFGVTVGAARFTPDVAGLDDETKFAISVGGGVRFPITDHFGIRLDIRSFVTFLEDDSQIFCVSDPGNVSGCAIRPKSDTFVQYTGSLGFSVGF
jgi:hypothetical protein